MADDTVKVSAEEMAALLGLKRTELTPLVAKKVLKRHPKTQQFDLVESVTGYCRYLRAREQKPLFSDDNEPADITCDSHTLCMLFGTDSRRISEHTKHGVIKKTKNKDEYLLVPSVVAMFASLKEDEVQVKYRRDTEKYKMIKAKEEATALTNKRKAEQKLILTKAELSTLIGSMLNVTSRELTILNAKLRRLAPNISNKARDEIEKALAMAFNNICKLRSDTEGHNNDDLVPVQREERLDQVGKSLARRSAFKLPGHVKHGPRSYSRRY